MTLNDVSPVAVIASPPFPVTQLPRVRCSSLADVEAIIDRAHPVVITPCDEIGFGSLLTPHDLLHAFDGASVNVDAVEHGHSRADTGSGRRTRQMTFADFADRIETRDNHGIESLYLSQFPLNAVPARLGSEVSEPGYIPESCPVVSSNLWFGSAGTVSPLHFDQNHNLLHQHHGRKHVILVHPSQFFPLEPGEKNSPREHISSLDLLASRTTIDLSRFKFSCYETVLGPGDILFIPAFWWHHIVSADPAISVNYWWRAPINACLYPGLFRFLSSRFVYHDPSVVASSFDLGQYTLGTELCVFLAEAGHSFGAAALTGAIVTASCFKLLRTLGLAAKLPENIGHGDILPDFTQARTAVRALAAQELINDSQADLLLKWIGVAREMAAETGCPVFPPERAEAINSEIQRLHGEFGKWLSTW